MSWRHQGEPWTLRTYRMSSPAAAWRYPCRPRARNEAPGIGLTTAPGVRSAPEAVIAFSTKTGTFDQQPLAQTTAEMRQARKPSNWCRTTRAYPSSWKWVIVCMAAKFIALGLWQFNGARGHDQPTVPRHGHGARALRRRVLQSRTRRELHGLAPNTASAARWPARTAPAR